MRFCLIFLTSFSLMVVAEFYGEAAGSILDGHPDAQPYRNIFAYRDFRQPPLQGDADYIQAVFDEEKVFNPEYTYQINDEDDQEYSNNRRPFAVPPSNPLYFNNDTPKPINKKDTMNKKMMPYNFDSSSYADVFSDRRTQRQNPNLSKFNKPATSTDQPNTGPFVQKLHSFGVKDIPTSLIPAPLHHNSLLKEAIRNHPNRDSSNQVMNIYIYAMIASVIAATCVIVAAFAFGWYTIQKKMKAAADAEYPAYGVTGPNTNTSPSGDRRLAHSAQLYHYQHQKQQILAMEKNANERNDSVSDLESEDENEEGDYTVYECPGFATTGELEVKNPLFLDEPTPATPATVVKATEK